MKTGVISERGYSMRPLRERTIDPKIEKSVKSSAPSIQAPLRLSRLLQITQKLQSSLEVHQQLKIFLHEIEPQLSVNSLSFDQYIFTQEASSKNCLPIKISIGNIERHRCQYKLVIEEQFLGTLEFSRKKRFTPDEIVELESLVALLALPIRNALLYENAIKHAMTDALTGVGNRAHLNDILDRELKLTKRHYYRLSLLLIDVDYFKSINDQYGHQVGDMALKLIADSIRIMTRDTDRIFRFGGDEFVVLLDNTDECRARLVGERIRMHIENIKENNISAKKESLIPVINVTIGTATLLPDDSQQTLFSRADDALYRAKQKWRNRVETSLSENWAPIPGFAQTA